MFPPACMTDAEKWYNERFWISLLCGTLDLLPLDYVPRYVVAVSRCWHTFTVVGPNECSLYWFCRRKSGHWFRYGSTGLFSDVVGVSSGSRVTSRVNFPSPVPKLLCLVDITVKTQEVWRFWCHAAHRNNDHRLDVYRTDTRYVLSQNAILVCSDVDFYLQTELALTWIGTLRRDCRRTFGHISCSEDASLYALICFAGCKQNTTVNSCILDETLVKQPPISHSCATELSTRNSLRCHDFHTKKIITGR